jgi:hypothetical protein
MLLFVAIGGEVVLLLWNWLLPPLFGWREITFWQGVGILALARILFGGSGWRPSHRSTLRGRMADRMADRMIDRLSERWERMTPEERERFRQRMRERFGFDPSTSESKAQ